MKTRISAAVVGAGLLAGAMGGCGAQPQFSGAFFYGNLVGERRAETMREAAFDQLVRRAEDVGLAPVERAENRLIFRTQAPDWVGPGPDGEPVERSDTRILTVEVKSGAGAHSNSYRYLAYLSGAEPGGFTDDARARLGAALLAAREVFETPLATDFFPAATPPASPETGEN